MRISSDRISLFTIATGPRGACKTLFLTGKQCERLLKSRYLKLLKGIDNRVWSNYPVGFNYKCPIENKVVHLESLPLNMETLYTWDDDLVQGWVFIDEIDQWYDRQEWNSVAQRLINKGMTQIRKKKLNIMASIQDMSWLNSRGQFQTDIIVNCRESAFSPWGRKMGLDLGMASFVSFRDNSGVMTGYKYEESHREYRQIYWGRKFWNYYDTDYQFDPLESMTKYKLKVPTKEIVVGGRPDNADDVSPYQSEKKDKNFVLLSHLVEELKEEGRIEVPKSEFWKIAQERGFNGELWRGGMILRNLKVEKTGNKGSRYLLDSRGVGVG